MVEIKRVGTNIYKNIKKNGKKIVKILAKWKTWYLSKFKSENFSNFKKVQSAFTIRKPNFLIFILK